MATAINNQQAFIGRPPMDRGMFYRGEHGVATPTHALEELDDGLHDHGAVDENGLALTIQRDSQDIKMAGGETFVTVQTNYDETINVTLLQDELESVIATTFGDANYTVDEPTEDAGERTTIYHLSEPLPVSTFVLCAISGARTRVYVVNSGQVINVAEIKVLHTDVTRIVLTIKTYKSQDPAHKGANVVEYRDDGVMLPVVGGTP